MPDATDRARPRSSDGAKGRSVPFLSEGAQFGPGTDNLQLLLDYEDWTAGDPLPNEHTESSGITSLADNNTVRQASNFSNGTVMVEQESGYYQDGDSEHHTGPTDKPNFEGKDFYISFFVHPNNQDWICHHSFDANASGAWEGWEFRMNSNNFEFFVREDAAAKAASATDGSYSTGSTHFVEAWYTLSGPTVHLRVNDGTEVANSTTQQPTYPDREMGLGGRHSWSSGFFDGSIDMFLYEVAPQDGLFWPSESTWLYNSGNGRSSDKILTYNP